MTLKQTNIVILYLILVNIISFSSTASSISRICINGDDINIYWTKYNDTCNGFFSYEIFARINEFSPFKLVTTINNINICEYNQIGAKKVSTQWNYFIKVEINCHGNIYDIISDTISIDQVIPLPVEIDTVSIINNKIFIGWDNCKSTDTKGYLLYYVDNNNNNIIIDTIYGKYNTSYIDSISGNPSNSIIKYRISAIDSCNNISKISGQQNNILLTSNQDTCNQEVILNWNQYSFWNDSNYQVLIYFKSKSGKFQILDSIKGNRVSYIIKKLENKTEYEFYVRLKNNISKFTASSNITGITTDFVVDPDYIYLRNVSDNSNEIDLSWSIDRVSEIKQFSIYKGTDSTYLSLVNVVNYNNLTDFNISDFSVDINSNIYYYKITSTDYCNRENVQSNISRNILLKAIQTEDGFVLQWNNFYSWFGGIKNYFIYKNDSNNSNWVLEGNVDGNITQYNENLGNLDLKGKSMCFYIEAQEGDTDKLGFKENSFSNIVCIKGSPIIYIPDAFVPSGINKTFKPVGELINWKKSKIVIFDRWGEEIWREEGINDGWSGKSYKNKEAPNGVYFYKIDIAGENGRIYTSCGTVTLIR